MGPSRPTEAPRHVTKYLAPGESVTLVLKQHWVRVLPAFLCCFCGLVCVLVAGFAAPTSLELLTNAAWWIWLVLLAHLVWRFIEWRTETFVITDRRLLLVHGIVVKKVAMMPLSKVTDMSYNRSVLARILGFGTFVMESAGQEQALSTIDYVPRPDAIYRELCGLIFGTDHAPHEDAPRGLREDPLPRSPYPEGPWPRTSPDDVFDVDAYPTQDRPRAERTAPAYTPDEDASGLFTERTVPMPTSPSRRRGPGDDTDPYGMVTVPPGVYRQAAYDPYPMQNDTDPGGHDHESAWSVSREHATRPQPVRRSRRQSPPGPDAGHASTPDPFL